MKTFFAASALAIVLMASGANAAGRMTTHEEAATNGKCSIGVLDIATTKCIVDGPASAQITGYGNGSAGDDQRDPFADNFGSGTAPSVGQVTGTGSITFDNQHR